MEGACQLNRRLHAGCVLCGSDRRWYLFHYMGSSIPQLSASGAQATWARELGRKHSSVSSTVFTVH